LKLTDLLRKYCGRKDAFLQISTQQEVDEWPNDLQEAYQERAAIMEYEGGLSRDEAEEMAEELVGRNMKKPRQDGRVEHVE